MRVRRLLCFSAATAVLLVTATPPAVAAGSKTEAFTCSTPTGTKANTAYMASGGPSASTTVPGNECFTWVGVDARYTRNGQTHYTGMKFLEANTVSVSPGSVMGAQHRVIDGVVIRVDTYT